jgi:serine/threonine-protein kinase
MKDIGDYKQCPYCGYHTDSPQIAPYLPIRTVIVNKYLVGKLIEYNGDGATYMGWDLARKKAVNIREFLPDAIATRKEGETNISIMTGCEITFRDCYQSFLELWRKLVRLNGLSALISVVDVVEDLGTAYAVYEYTEGITLREYLLKTNTGYISWDKARAFMQFFQHWARFTIGHNSRGISPTTLIVVLTEGPISASASAGQNATRLTAQL